MTHENKITKSELLQQLDEVVRDVTHERDEFKSKMNTEVNVANRSYFQGQYVDSQRNLNRLNALRQMMANW